MQIYEVSRYITLNLPPIAYYVDQLLSEEGSMVIYGDAGAMKSWLAEHLAWCVATGTEWLGFETTQARVLIVNFEISERWYHWRLRQMGTHFTLPNEQALYVSSPGETSLINRANFDRFFENIREIAPQVMILDCFQAFYGGDENSHQEVGVMYSYLREITRELGTAIVIVHHTNRDELRHSPMSRERGAGLRGRVDSVLYLVSQPNGRQIIFEKHRVADHVIRSMNIYFEDFLWHRRNPPMNRGGVNEETVVPNET